LEKTGYHLVGYFASQLEVFSEIPKAILAVSSYVKGSGTFVDGKEYPRITVTLATKIPEEKCQKVGLSYRDPSTIDPDEWRNREDEGILLVEKAGENLYLPENA
jgi:hypothetical protein